MCFLLLAVNAAYAPWAANIGNGCPLGYQYGGYGSTTMCVPKSEPTYGSVVVANFYSEKANWSSKEDL